MPIHERGLTPRSSRAPTAGHAGRVGGTLYILANPARASHRWCRLSSNVRPRNSHPMEAVSCFGNATILYFVEGHYRQPVPPHAPALLRPVGSRTRSGISLQKCACASAALRASASHSATCTAAERVARLRSLRGRHRASASNEVGLSCSLSPARFRPPSGTPAQAKSSAVAARLGSPSRAWPNPSLKRSPNGGPPGPRVLHVYHRPRGPGVPPLGPA